MKTLISLSPQNVTPELWYYEEKRGIHIVHVIENEGKYLRTDQIIPWRKLKRTMHRYNRQIQEARG